MKKTPSIIKIAARKLRKNQTPTEKIVWEQVRDRKLGYKFQRQFCLYVYTEDSGFDRYTIPDFYCSEKKIIIEIDGNIHNNKEIYELDVYKQKLLKKQNYSIIRIRNEEVLNNPSSAIQKIVASLSCKEREFKSELGSTEDVLQQKHFTMHNDSFTCDNCKKEITKHPGGSARNHCPYCLYSKHLDKDFPGDRASECLSIMKPVGKDYKKNKSWMIIHECQKCSKKIPNKLAEDDNIDVFGRL